jgi:acetyl-CoA C-acetyltransferase
MAPECERRLATASPVPDLRIQMPEAVIVSAVRSPIGRAGKGSLVDVRPDDLAATIVQAAFDRVPGLSPSDVDDLLLGCAEPSDEHGANLARRVAIHLGWDEVPGTTVNRFCASSVQTTRMAFHAIKAGEGDVFVSAGVECVSRYDTGLGAGKGKAESEHPAYAEARERTERAAATNPTWSDPRADGRLPDVYISMGQTAENVAGYRGVSRRDQDEFGALSQNRAEAAIANGVFAREIHPIAKADGTVVATDDGPRAGTTYEKLAQLQPVFRVDGTVTAGNCCPLNDGAAALIVMSDTRARELGVQPIARIVATGVSALSPEIMGLGPVEASRRALRQAGMTIDDIDLFEINEAFAAQVLPSADDLGIDVDRLNVHGGAIALGHPFGMTGARITTTLLNAMQLHDKQYGLETMCVGGGQGMAIVFERLS